MPETKKRVRSRTTERKIGNITYIVTAHFNENGGETAEQIISHLLSDRVAAEMKSA